jgi:hypothetical protein
MSSSLQDVSIKVGLADVSSLKEAFRIVRQIWAMVTALPQAEQLESIIATGASIKSRKITEEQKKSLGEMVKAYEAFFRDMADVWNQVTDTETSRITAISDIVDATVEKLRVAMEGLEQAVSEISSEVGIKHIRETMKAVREMKINLLGRDEEAAERGPGRPMPRIKQWLQEYYKTAVSELRKQGITIEKAEISGIRGTTLFKNIEKRVNEAFGTFVKEELTQLNEKLVGQVEALKVQSREIRKEEIDKIFEIVERIKDAISTIIEDPETIAESITALKDMVEDVRIKEFVDRLEQIDPTGIVKGIEEKFVETMKETFSTERLDAFFKTNLKIEKVRRIVGATAKVVNEILRESLTEFMQAVGEGKPFKVQVTGEKFSGGRVAPVSPSSVEVKGMTETFTAVNEFMEGREEIDKANQQFQEMMTELFDDLMDQVGNIDSGIDQILENIKDVPSAEIGEKIDIAKTEIIESINTLAETGGKMTRRTLEERIRGLPVTRITKIRPDIVTAKQRASREMKKVLSAVRGMKASFDNTTKMIRKSLTTNEDLIEEFKRGKVEEEEEPTSTTRMSKTRTKRRK